MNTAIILESLKTLEEKGFKHYGTTIRPIRNVIEFETETGHIYLEAFSKNLE